MNKSEPTPEVPVTEAQRKGLPIEVLLVQVLVLVFTGALWWIARRDLAARVPPPAAPPADTADLEQLCATLETLVTRLARRLEAVEKSMGAAVPKIESAAEETSPIIPRDSWREPVPDSHSAPVYALLDAGVSDPVEIARQTGLGRGEVDLILSLRDRRAF